jgi:hypothetical protein
VYDLPSPILFEDECYLRYTQPGDGVVSLDAGVELASITGTSKSIDNQSTVTSLTYFPLTDPNLVSLWYFDNNTTDTQGNNNLTNYGAVAYNTGTKIQGTHSAYGEGLAKNFRIEDASLAGIDFSGDFTVGTWVYITTDAADAKIISKWDVGTSNREFDLTRESSDDSIIVQFSHDGGSVNMDTFQTAAGTFPISTWVHLIVSHNATTHAVRLHKDGANLTSGSFPATATGVPYPAGAATLALKGSAYDSSRPCNGYMDEAFFVDRVMTDQEISNLYNNGFDTGR